MPAGRPTSFKPEYVEQARKLCLLGATDPELADFFDVCRATIDNWKNEFPEFLDALKSGKKIADMHIAQKLFNRAEGATWTEQQAFKVKKPDGGEEVIVVDVKKGAPPDTTAIIFWLKNRAPKAWRDKQDVELAGAEGGPVQIQEIRRVIVDPKVQIPS
jgi:hypothetical protein